MNTRWLNVAVGILFLIVGILATANSIRLNRYISETLPRDAAQERCAAQTVQTLKDWGENRNRRDQVLDARDDAVVVIIDRLIAGQEKTPEELQAWKDAVTAERQSRHDTVFAPLPQC